MTQQMTPKIDTDLDFLIDQYFQIKDERIYEIPSDYVEKIRYIPKGLSPKPGFYEFSFTPYLREIFNCLASDSGVNEIAFMKPAQIGYNVGVLENAILYFIGSDPKYVQFVTADNELAKQMVKERIDPMIDQAGLRNLIFAQAKRKGSNSTGDTILHKEYKGGAINFVGAKNPDAFRGRTRQISLLDEIDTYADDAKEGSKIGIIRNRSNAFAESRKIVYGSTPLILQTSKIYKLYLMGDQRNYYVPCPRCGEMIVLYWNIKNEHGVKCGITFESSNGLPLYDTVAYKCQICEQEFKDNDKVFFLLDKGEWRPTAESRVPNFRSYWLNALYSPPGVYSWEKIVEDWARAWDLEKNRVKDIEAYREFRNTKQGLPFEERGSSIKYEKSVTFRRSGFVLGQIPDDIMLRDTGSECMLLTCAIDVQSDGVFIHTTGWTVGGQSWTIDFFKLDGNIKDSKSELWQQIDEYITEKIYVSSTGKRYRIINTFIDSGWGKYSDQVYQFCQEYSNGVYAIKGEDTIPGNLIYKLFTQKTLEKIGLQAAYIINTTKLKDRISYFLSKLQWDTGELQPRWYPNYPENLGDEFFRMFEAEYRVDIKNKITNKYLRSVWKNPDNKDNHAFDTSVYNLAGLELVADRTCREYLGLQVLDWSAFWEYCQTGAFFS